MAGVRLKSHARIVITAVMEQEGWSQARVAANARCSKAFVGHLISGRRDSCTPELAARIARSLGVSPRVLFAASVSSDR
ncbi:HTH DNA-binding protein [Gordonia phage BetterKatz]|uniref:HTH DNA-binding protein n=1 Tax=Gordonia phage BetterKatz TaxID=1821551 RepID=A0A142KC43_9CAUD|nr:HTH DNA-binding protein [Gordonia phage BetterKatz]AMS03676.1 HTH DNA-binding protein [Gordonia phage BetterKatz]